MEKNLKNNIHTYYIYIYPNHFAVHLKITQYCKSTLSSVAQSCPALCNPMDCSSPIIKKPESLRAGKLHIFQKCTQRNTFGRNEERI